MTNSYVCDMTHSCVWHDSFICVTWLIHMCDMTNSYVCDMTHSCVWSVSCSFVWHDSFGARHLEKVVVRVTWLTYVWHDSIICVRWLIHVCDMTHPCVWHDVFICVTWLIHMCDMTHSYCVTWPIYICDMARFLDATHHLVKVFLSVTCLMYMWHDSFIRVTWLIYMCDMTYSFVWHGSLSRCGPPPYELSIKKIAIHIRDMIRSYVWHELFMSVTYLIHMFDMIYTLVWHDSFPFATHMNESCHIWISHATYERIMPHIWINHVTYEGIMSHTGMSHVTYE